MDTATMLEDAGFDVIEADADAALLILEHTPAIWAVFTDVDNLLKREWIRRRTYRPREEARQDVFDYIEMFYNPKRRHVRNGMLSPVEFEQQQKM